MSGQAIILRDGKMRTVGGDLVPFSVEALQEYCRAKTAVAAEIARASATFRAGATYALTGQVFPASVSEAARGAIARYGGTVTRSRHDGQLEVCSHDYLVSERGNDQW